MSSTFSCPAKEGYKNYNYCAVCAVKYSKDVLWCPDCGYKVRTKARGQSAKNREERLEKLGLKRY